MRVKVKSENLYTKMCKFVKNEKWLRVLETCFQVSGQMFKGKTTKY